MASVIRFRKKLKALMVHARSLIQKPIPFDFRPEEKRAVFVICHPDDETSCSGLICSLVANEWQLSLVCATRGEGANSEKTSQEVAAIRTRELMNAAAKLGIAHVEFLDMPDNGRWDLTAADATPATFERLEKVFQNMRPSVVITHGRDGEYGHPGHLKTRQLCLRAAENNAPCAVILGMNAACLTGPMRHLKNNTAPPHYRIDGSRHSATRLAALNQHKSQAFVFADWAGNLETFVRNTQIEYYSIDRPAT